MNRLATVFIILLLMATTAPFVSPANKPQTSGRAAEELTTKSSITRDIHGGERHSFQITLHAGQFARAEVVQSDIDVAVSLFDPDGKLVIEMDGNGGQLWRESVSCIAENPGAYRLEVRAYGPVDKAGRYEATLKRSREAISSDRKWVEAEKLLAEGRKLQEEGEAQISNAVRRYEESAGLWGEMGEGYWEAVALVNLGSAYADMHEPEKALTAERRAADLSRGSRDRLGEAKSLNVLGTIYCDLGELEKALRYFEQALPIRREVKDRRGEGATLSNIGFVYEMLGPPEKALRSFEQALTIAREVKDRSAQCSTLSNIGTVHWILGQMEKALGCFEDALVISREVRNRREEGYALCSIGKVYGILGQPEKALSYFEQALLISREVKDRGSEADALGGIGNIYGDLDQLEKALSYFELALAIQRELKDRINEGRALCNIGHVYSRLGQAEKALSYFEQSLAISRQVRDRRGEANALGGLGDIYSILGQPDDALTYFEQELPIRRELKDRRGEGKALGSIGNVYGDLDEPDQALTYYEQALVIQREVKDRRSEGSTLGNMGQVYRMLGQLAKALSYSEQALAIRREIKDRAGEGNTLDSIGTVFGDLGQPEKALSYFEQALAIRREVKDRVGEGHTLGDMMFVEAWLKRPRLAIFFGKQAVNTFQEIRGNIRNLDKELQRGFLENKEGAYRELAAILISEGRLPEAELVIDLLKEKEFSRLLRRSGNSDSLVPYSNAEAAAIETIDRLAALGRERSELLKKLSLALAPDSSKRLNELDAEIAMSNRALHASLAAISSADATAKDKVLELREEQSLMGTLRELPAGAVALYTVIATKEQSEKGRDKVARVKTGWVILVTPDFRKAYPIDVDGIEEIVFAFRNALRSDKYDPQSLAQNLYRRIFLQTSGKQRVTLAQDLETYLGKQEKKTLMWSLDGVLRYVPMAALHDGRQYLVERYRNVVFNVASLPSLKDAVSEKWSALGYGVTEAREEAGKKFDRLEGVERELRAIIRDYSLKTSEGIMPGTIRLNQAFTKQSLTEGLRSGAPLVHIASHFSYNSAVPERSFLLLGASHMTVEEMQDLSNPFEKVELLTLSACDTAMGSANGKEVEGLAYVAQSLGAKSVIASLWPVSDRGTDELMVRFYKIRTANPQMTKSDAFNQAQFAALRGDESARNESQQTRTGTNGGRDRGTEPLSGHSAEVPLYKADPNKPFAHPHYWAAFILIGNWK